MNIQWKSYSISGNHAIKNVNMTNIIPINWCVKITEDNRITLEKWRKTVCSVTSEYTCLMEDALNKYLLSNDYEFTDHMYWGTGIPEDYNEISFEEFVTSVLKEKYKDYSKPEDLSYLIPILEKFNIK